MWLLTMSSQSKVLLHWEHLNICAGLSVDLIYGFSLETDLFADGFLADDLLADNLLADDSL